MEISSLALCHRVCYEASERKTVGTKCSVFSSAIKEDYSDSRRPNKVLLRKKSPKSIQTEEVGQKALAYKLGLSFSFWILFLEKKL